MSEIRRAAIIAAIALAVAAPGAAQSPSPAGTVQAADARATALRERYVRAWRHHDGLKRSIDSATNALSASTPADSVVAGAIVIRLRGEPFPAALREAVDRGAVMAWTSAQAMLGGSSGLLASHPVDLTRLRRTFWQREPSTLLAFPGRNARWHPIPTGTSAEGVGDALLDVYGSLVGTQLPPSVKQWAQGEWLPLAPNRPEAWEGAFLSLATSRSSYARRCYEGAMADCLVALDLTGNVPTDSLDGWYRDSDLPALVSEYRGRDSAERALFRECAKYRNGETCDRAARYRSIPPPVSQPIRHALLAFAVERGGPQAVARLLAARGTASEALATTAGIPLDQLLVEWREKVVRSVPEKTVPGVLEGAAVLAWSSLFAFLATRRRP